MVALIKPPKTANRIREVREAVGISQIELGRRIEMSEPTINRYENGNRKPTRQVLFRIAKALDVPLQALFIDLVTMPTQVNERSEESTNGTDTL